MAKKIDSPTDEKVLADLIAAKTAAGLSPADAAEVAKRQLDHDAELADAAEAAAAKPAKQ